MGEVGYCLHLLIGFDCVEVAHGGRLPAMGGVGPQVMFRVSPEVHRKAALAAELSGKSLNQWADDVLDRAAR